ncbi:MAG: hypothetical protein HETSPECPRED_009346 [Heterodermia speciosa]|uniref:Uncharacterized protein n=1 Tax=Heterodermia speciosa TaxID=116794 RepID=A0A8H3G155_9LECA|nr:MAG: hypothetical protein HETSPECPRED_009346 [Heterodermia speciosa]
MPRSPSQHRLYSRLSGRQARAPYLSKLPLRYLSDDGLCAIDVKLPQGSKGDTTSDRAIAGAARSVLFECVEDHGWGGRLEVPYYGFAKDYRPSFAEDEKQKKHLLPKSVEYRQDLKTLSFCSSKRELFLEVSKYEPAVDCDPRPAQSPSFDSCEDMLQDMPAGSTILKCSTDRAQATGGCLLPRDFYAQSGLSRPLCRALVEMPNGLTTRETYFNIYAAGVAVNVMCVQHGFTGRAFHIGRNGAITISINAIGH